MNEQSKPNPEQNGDEPILSQPTNKATPRRMREFLRAYAESGDITAAAKAAGIHRSLHYAKIESDAAYRKAFQTAQQEIGERLEAAAVRYAMGTRKLVFYQGQPLRQDGELVYETVHDTHLMQLLLKRFLPTEYRERISQEISGSINFNLAERLAAARARLIELDRKRNGGTTGMAG